MKRNLLGLLLLVFLCAPAYAQFDTTVDGHSIGKVDILDFDAIPEPAESPFNHGRIYFDDIDLTYKCSLDGVTYTDCHTDAASKCTGAEVLEGSGACVANAGGGATTEAALELQLTDVTDVFTNNDGSLTDDDLTDDDIETLQNVDTGTAVRDALMRMNNAGTQWVPVVAPTNLLLGYDLVYTGGVISWAAQVSQQQNIWKIHNPPLGTNPSADSPNDTLLWLTSDGNIEMTGDSAADSIDVTLAANITADLTGNADTATALAANGPNCSVGNYPLGVNASGGVEGCTADADTQNTLDEAYDEGGAGVGRSITADSGAFEVTVPDTGNNIGFIVNQDDVTNDPIAAQINQAGDGVALEIVGTETSNTVHTVLRIESNDEGALNEEMSRIDFVSHNASGLEYISSSITDSASGSAFGLNTAGDELGFLEINVSNSGTLARMVRYQGNIASLPGIRSIQFSAPLIFDTLNYGAAIYLIQSCQYAFNYTTGSVLIPTPTSAGVRFDGGAACPGGFTGINFIGTGGATDVVERHDVIGNATEYKSGHNLGSLVAGDTLNISDTNTGLLKVGNATNLTRIKWTTDGPIVVTACGTSPSITGDDMHGKVTIGTGGVTSCTLTFKNDQTVAPICNITGDGVTGISYHASTTNLVLTITEPTDMSGDVIMYNCSGI